MELIGIGILVFAAAIVGTVTGFGIGTTMVPVMAALYSPPPTLLFVGVIHLFGSLWKVLLFREGVSWKIITAFGITAVIASFIGASVTIQAPEALLKSILGLFLVAYAVSVFVKSNFALPKNSGTLAVGGAVSGFTSGIFGIGGEIRAMVLSAFNLPKAVFLATSGVLGLFVDASRLATYLGGGIRLEPFFLWGLLIFVPVSFVGAKIAQRIVQKIPQDKFRKVVAVFLLAAGVYLFFV